MEETLGQRATDEMVAAMQAEADSEESAAAASTASGPEPFNFSRAGEIHNERMRAISAVNDVFSRNLMLTMGAWLRTKFEVIPITGEQLPFGEFVGRLSKPLYVCSIRLEPFDAVGLMELDLTLAWPILDLLLGGVGEAAAPRVLTDIEESLLESVLRRITQELNLAWGPVGLKIKFERRETEDQVERVLAPLERALSVRFELRMGETRGALNLCFPASVLNALLRGMVTDGARPRRRSSDTQIRIRELMGGFGVGTVLQFPPMRLRAKELAMLGPGSILRLPLPKHAEAEIRIGGLSLGRAQPVRTGEHRGARLESFHVSASGVRAGTLRANLGDGSTKTAGI